MPHGILCYNNLAKGDDLYMRDLLSECTDYDFKQELEERKPKSWLKSVSAFSNGLGGSIFFGFDDNGKAVGLEDCERASDKISEIIKEKISPAPLFSLTPHLIEGKAILELKVPSGPYTPYYYSSDGNKIAYVRNGNESIPAPTHILNELILKGKGQTYDSIDSGLNKNDFAFSILKSSFLKNAHSKFEETDYISFRLLLPNGNLTRAGALLADENPYFQSRIFCTRWNGIDKISEETVLDDAEINGSLLNQLDRAMAFFRSNTKKSWKKEGGNTVWKYEYDEEAVKEALVNAIIHRDYNNMGAEVVLNIYNDRIEITSPGMMFDGGKVPLIVTSTVVSQRRNPIIADVFWRMGLMNRRGSGLANITNKTNLLFNDENNHVFFKTENGFFKTLIYNAEYHANNGTINGTINLTEQEKSVIALIGGGEKMTVSEMSAMLNIPLRTFNRILLRLKTKGLIRHVDSNKTGHWEIIDG